MRAWVYAIFSLLSKFLCILPPIQKQIAGSRHHSLSRSYYYLRRRSPGPPFPPDHRQAGERLWGNGGYDEIEFEKCRDFIFEPGDFRGEFIFVTQFLLLFIVVDVFTVSAFVICVSYTFLLYASCYMLSNQLNSTGEEEDEFTPGPHPDLVEDRIGLDDRVLCFHGSSFLSIWPARSYRLGYQRYSSRGLPQYSDTTPGYLALWLPQGLDGPIRCSARGMR